MGHGTPRTRRYTDSRRGRRESNCGDHEYENRLEVGRVLYVLYDHQSHDWYVNPKFHPFFILGSTARWGVLIDFIYRHRDIFYASDDSKGDYYSIILAFFKAPGTACQSGPILPSVSFPGVLCACTDTFRRLIVLEPHYLSGLSVS